MKSGEKRGLIRSSPKDPRPGARRKISPARISPKITARAIFPRRPPEDRLGATAGAGKGRAFPVQPWGRGRRSPRPVPHSVTSMMMPKNSPTRRGGISSHPRIQNPMRSAVRLEVRPSAFRFLVRMISARSLALA